MTKGKLKTKMFGILGGVTLLATPLVVVSCSGSTTVAAQQFVDENVSALVQEYNSEYKKAAGGNKYFQYTDDNKGKIIDVVKQYLKKADIMQYANLSVDGRIWLNSFVDQLETKLQLLESDIHYLIITNFDTLAFTNYRNQVARYISTAINNLRKASQAPAANAELDAITTFLTAVMKNLTDGLSKNITVSKVIMKHAIGNLLQQSFMRPILDLYVKNGTKPTKDQIKTQNLLPFKSTVADASKVEATNDKLFEFIKYITGDYYNGIKYGGTHNSTYTLTIQDNNPNEEDNGYITSKDGTNKYIAGLGLSTQDLEAKDVGVGFIPNGNGKKIYNALLRLNSNTTKSANEIFTLGNSGVKKIKDNMKEVAKTVASIHVGPNQTWSPTGEYYDADSSGTQYGSQLADQKLVNTVTADGTVDLSKFFIYMNTDRWFNGRDMRQEQYPTWDGTEAGKIVSSYTGNPNNWDGKTEPYTYKAEFIPVNSGITSLKISDVIGAKGDMDPDNTVVWGDAGNLYYKYLVVGSSPATIQSNYQLTNIQNSISPEAAFVGTSNAIHQYLQYKDVSAEHFNGMFYDTSVDFTLRTGTGGAAYASSGSGSWSYVPNAWGGFYLDANPYFGLQKWSMTSLGTHESISGHVYQFNYAHDHPGKDYAPSFSSTAYGEGWGLFSEWLAVQIGMYGEPVQLENLESDRLQLPAFGKNSKNIDVTQFKEKNEYANGAYWIDDDKSTPDVVEPAGNSQKLFDAVQYFGFLNERQLRAMRCAVDVGIHAGGPTADNNGDISDTSSAGAFTTGTGWSLKQAREYLSKNSGLGIDDINRETKRYLEYTGQAVSYYNGLEVMEGLYMKALNTFKTNNPGQEFLNWSNTIATNKNTAPLFDIILRNDDVPIQVLDNAVTHFIETNEGYNPQK